MASHSESGQIKYDAAVFIIQNGVMVATIVRELKELIGTSQSKTPIQLCSSMVYDVDGNWSDFHDQVVQELTTSFPSMTRESIISISASSTPVQRGFAIKQALDSRKISDFVIFSTEESLSALLVVKDTIFTSAYNIRVKIYSGSIVDIPELLANTSDDVKSTIKRDCSKYLAELTISPYENLEVIKSDLICSKTFAHGFSTRKGGCSSYPSVASLNLVFRPEKRDPAFVVEENRYRLLNSVGTPSHRFEVAKAVHGNTVWVVGTPQLPGYDAIVCNKPSVVIAAPAADCVTIILADENRSVCAAVHSGWKGTLANVIGATITTMTERFGCKVQDVRSAIGPSIGPCCYEVGMDVEKLFRDNPLLSQCMETVEGKTKKHLNLQKALRIQLENIGVSSEHIDDTPSKLCTRCNGDRFYSYRRDGRPFGTHIGFIGLRAVE